MCKAIFEQTIELAENTMLNVRPELFDEWDFKRNKEIDIYKVTYGSGKLIWWLCSNCDSSYDMTINQRVLQKQNCPYCAGYRVNQTNSLATLNPQLASQWHPTLNGELTPHDVTSGSHRKVWWIGDCGHEWESGIDNRNQGRGCPYCNGKKILIGFNDIWTTNPDLASLLVNPEDGYKYMQYSNKKVNWKCSECGETIKNKTIAKINEHGLSCPSCADGFSFPEKVMYHLLNEVEVTFEIQKTFEWAKDKRYDFYIPLLNTIIETHGKQHYEEQGRKGARTLKEEQENDKLKRELAIQNGIEDYIVIDCRKSELEWIKDNILNSRISEIFNLHEINWINISKKSNTSLIKIVCDLWDSVNNNVAYMSNKLSLSENTVVKYLKIGSELGWCDYNAKEEIVKSINKRIIKFSKKVIQLDMQGEELKVWNSIKEASVNLNIDRSSISACCRGRYITVGGFKWKYKE